MSMLRALRYTAAVVITAAVALSIILTVFPWPSNLEIISPDPEQRAEAFEQARGLMIAAEPAVDDGAERYRPLPPDTGRFSTPAGLRPVVDFWKRVYTSIYSFQAVIHDSEDVTRIYDIVDLRSEGYEPSQGSEGVRKAVERVLDRYKGNMRYLFHTKYDPHKLRGERRSLHLFVTAHGGKGEFKDADKRMRVQRGLRDVFADSIRRSGRYIEEYRRIFRERGLPEELSLLPHLESSYAFDAHSAAGAVGIWQLTRGASASILHVNSVVDERIDPWKSAEAAARILGENYRRLHSWPLAVTAYNQGLGAMRRAVDQVGSADIEQVVRRYKSRSFGFAGRNFYCAFVATVEVVHNHEEYFGLLRFDEPVRTRHHTLSRSLPLKTIARELGVDTSTLAELNPHLRRPAHDSGAVIPRGAVINLPVSVVEEP